MNRAQNRVISAAAYGCHFQEFPQSQQQALLALCVLTGIKFLKNKRVGREKKELKHSLQQSDNQHIEGEAYDKNN